MASWYSWNLDHWYMSQLSPYMMTFGGSRFQDWLLNLPLHVVKWAVTRNVLSAANLAPNLLIMPLKDLIQLFP